MGNTLSTGVGWRNAEYLYDYYTINMTQEESTTAGKVRFYIWVSNKTSAINFDRSLNFVFSGVTGLVQNKTGYTTGYVEFDSSSLNNTINVNWGGYGGIGGNFSSATMLGSWSKCFSLTVSKGNGVASYVLKHTSSIASSTEITSSPAIIYSGDVISLDANKTVVLDGYTLSHFDSITVDNSDVSINLSTSPSQYTLIITTPPNCTIVVKRGDIILSSGASISHFDVLTAERVPSPGYALKDGYEALETLTVTGNINITCEVKALALSRVFHDGEWKTYLCYIYSNDKWVMACPHVYTSGFWKQYY